jgi:hypothetical protein
VLALIRDGEQAPGTYVSAFAVGNLMWAALWFGITIRGYQMARRRRWVEHRRLMIYSFALTLAIMWSRVVIGVAESHAIPGFNLVAFFEIIGWLPWVGHLLAAQWWINRTSRRPLALPATASSAGMTDTQPQLLPVQR